MDMLHSILDPIFNIILWDAIIPCISIPIIDWILCNFFGTKTRWFQLHSVINGVVVYIIYPDVIELFTNPLSNIGMVNSKMETYFIILLHIYHIFIVEQLTFMDYFHHILFIGGGCIPTIILYNSKLVRLGWLACCGIPGLIEYSTLSLVKHNKLKVLTQKKLNSYIYNYIRYPLILYCITITYIAYTQKLTIECNPWVLIYINGLLFFNGSFYNKLTIENYIIHKKLTHVN